MKLSKDDILAIESLYGPGRESTTIKISGEKRKWKYFPMG